MATCSAPPPVATGLESQSPSGHATTHEYRSGVAGAGCGPPAPAPRRAARRPAAGRGGYRRARGKSWTAKVWYITPRDYRNDTIDQTPEPIRLGCITGGSSIASEPGGGNPRGPDVVAAHSSRARRPRCQEYDGRTSVPWKVTELAEKPKTRGLHGAVKPVALNGENALCCSS